MKITGLINDFIESEQTSGYLLIACTFLSLLLANSVFNETYFGIWNYDVNGHSLTHWINDGLMAIFFLLIGLELEREVYIGELSTTRKAALPVMAALGGMVIPAGVYFAFNKDLPTQSGMGIPMATDIAFAVGILSLIGNRVPASLKIFLMALAVIDDLGAIAIIAFFYSKSLSFLHLGISLSIFVLLLILNRAKVTNLFYYLIGGVAMWYFMLHSGVHATISGVLLAFAIPFESGSKDSVSFKLQQFLHKPVAFVILPLFALANTCLIIAPDWYEQLATPGSLGIIAGLLAGKPIGIMLFCFISVAIGLCRLPDDISWKHLTGVGLLAGIGFTMSIFITLIAFSDQELITNSKIAILVASLSSAIAGIAWLRFTGKRVVNGSM